MTVAIAGAGATAVGTTSLALPYPTGPGPSAGELLIACIIGKYPPNFPSTPTNWILPTNGQGSGGAGADGPDTGNVHATVFLKEADGTETGNLTVSIPSGNSSAGIMLRATRTGGAGWEYACAHGADSTGGTAWSVTGNVDPGLTAGDLVIVVSGANTDFFGFSGHAIAATGISAWGTVVEHADLQNTQGEDTRLVVSEHPVSTGTSSAAPVYTATASGSGVDRPCGSSVFLRLREAASVTAYRDSSLRARLQVPAYRDAGLRADVQAAVYRDSGLRAGLQATAYRDAGARVRIQDVAGESLLTFLGAGG
jgi:MSHA biogenesis protein MshQ